MAISGLILLFIGLFFIVNQTTEWIPCIVSIEIWLIVTILVIGATLFGFGLGYKRKGD